MKNSRKFATSQASYDNPDGAKHYLQFLASEDGQFFQKILSEAFLERLGTDTAQTILDVACGPGWLTNLIAKNYPNTQACDGSTEFLQHAQSTYPKLKFTQVNLNETLPYADAQFDTLIMSMAAHDVEDQVKTFSELRRIIKPNGKLMLTMVNPYYAYPVGVWKRGILGRLLFRKPKLLIRAYHLLAKNPERNFTFQEVLECYFYKLSEHLNHITVSGFKFSYMKDLESLQDSPDYNLQYRLHRFPVIIYLEFIAQ